jgi:hypothetical protein
LKVAEAICNVAYLKLKQRLDSNAFGNIQPNSGKKNEK